MKFLTLIFISLFLSINSYANKYSFLKDSDYFLLADRDSGEILISKNKDKRIEPSSMTKLMTAYVIFDQLKQGNINLDEECQIDMDSWRKRGSTMFLNLGDIVTIEKLIHGLLIVSGNDASIALAKATSKTEEEFIELMNRTAIKIGMLDTQFQNPHGLNEKDHYTTLNDLFLLTKRIWLDFPQFMPIFSKKYYKYGNIKQPNRNPLIAHNYDGAMGLKTGYTDGGGYGVVGAAVRGNRRLIAVTNGNKTSTQRSEVIKNILDYGFDRFKKITIFNKNDIVTKLDVWLGNKSEVPLITRDEISITIPKYYNIEDIKILIKHEKPINPIIVKGEKIADLIIKFSDKEISKTSLFANDDIVRAGYFQRFQKILSYRIDNFLKK
ncbi:D-alanyl-D-alanine carboxypeptidase [Rickettsiales bacterium]|nr:D-alanyl-D-alanine carboxypeptidase [Rickettsiales bacterium]